MRDFGIGLIIGCRRIRRTPEFPEHRMQQPIPLHVVTPPYEKFEPARDSAEVELNLDAGVLLALDVRQTSSTVPLDEFARCLRKANPAAPLVARIPTGSKSAADLARRLGLLEVSALVTDDDPPPATLRASLSRPVQLEERLVRWFDLLGHTDLVLARVIRALFSGSQIPDLSTPPATEAATTVASNGTRKRSASELRSAQRICRNNHRNAWRCGVLPTDLRWRCDRARVRRCRAEGPTR